MEELASATWSAESDHLARRRAERHVIEHDRAGAQSVVEAHAAQLEGAIALGGRERRAVGAARRQQLRRALDPREHLHAISSNQ